MAGAGVPSHPAAGARGAARPLLRRVLSPWSLVGASVVVSAEAALFLSVAAVPLAVGAAVFAVAALSGVVGVLRLVADHRAAAAAVVAAPRSVRLPGPRVTSPAGMPRPRRSHEDTSTGPLSLV